MAQERPTVADIFRRAQTLHRENPNVARKDLKKRLLGEYNRGEFPPVESLAIPEQDVHAPEEDWSAGLSLVLRGIQMKNWAEVINGVVFCLDQTEQYIKERGSLGVADTWHDRDAGIRNQVNQSVGKWMPAELQRLAAQRPSQQVAAGERVGTGVSQLPPVSGDPDLD